MGSISGTSALLLLTLCTLATAQLLSCAEVDGCPMSENGIYTTCKLENHEVGSVGISQLNTSISSSPLSWTVTSSSRRLEGDPLDLTQKDFYLGLPPDLDLSNLTSVKGCALFFQGISPALQFQNNREDVGTCEDALTTICVQDLIAQAKSAVDDNVANLDCDELATTLQANPPRTCPHWYGNWGLVTSHTITEQGRPGPIQTDNCNPTISKIYSVNHVESFNASTNTGVLRAGLLNFFYGITPVMTIFAPTSLNNTAGSTGPVLDSSEVHLNCLRTKVHGNTSSVAQSSASRSSSDYMILSPSVGLVVGLLVSLWAVS